MFCDNSYFCAPANKPHPIAFSIVANLISYSISFAIFITALQLAMGRKRYSDFRAIFVERDALDAPRDTNDETH